MASYRASLGTLNELIADVCPDPVVHRGPCVSAAVSDTRAGTFGRGVPRTGASSRGEARSGPSTSLDESRIDGASGLLRPGWASWQPQS
jgi:hypothetical protein